MVRPQQIWFQLQFRYQEVTICNLIYTLKGNIMDLKEYTIFVDTTNYDSVIRMRLTMPDGQDYALRIIKPKHVDDLPQILSNALTDLVQLVKD